jgi:hypothetical protein
MEMKRDMVQLLMEGGIGSILNIRRRNRNDNAKPLLRANQTPLLVVGPFGVGQEARRLWAQQ